VGDSGLGVEVWAGIPPNSRAGWRDEGGRRRITANMAPNTYLTPLILLSGRR
jgi:hypothetical protein